jgi:hypothetical protein
MGPPDPPLPGREGLGVGSTQELGTMTKNMLGCGVRIADDLIVPEAKYCPAFAFEERGAPRVVSGSISMLATI